MSKQVKGAVVETVSAANSSPQTETKSTSSQERNLHIKVETFSAEGKTIGTRIVDMYHFGTRNWLQNHNWWAMHNNHQVETKVAEPEEVAEYVAQQAQALADKFSTEKQHQAA